MHKLRSIVAPLVLLTLILPETAQAADVSSRQMFGENPVSDNVLATQRGGFAISPSKVRYGLRWVVVDQVRSTQRLTTGDLQSVMDVWWGSVGSDLIAANVRAIVTAR